MPGIESIFHISEMHCAVRLINSNPWLHHQAVQGGDPRVGAQVSVDTQRPHGYPPGGPGFPGGWGAGE